MIGKIRIDSLEELINQPRLVKYDTYEFDELSYTCLLVDIRRLLEENKKYKEVIDKAIEVIEDSIEDVISGKSNCFDCLSDFKSILNILKEVEHE